MRADPPGALGEGNIAYCSRLLIVTKPLIFTKTDDTGAHDFSLTYCTDRYSGPGAANDQMCVCVCVTEQQPLNEMVFDLDIWYA